MVVCLLMCFVTVNSVAVVCILDDFVLVFSLELFSFCLLVCWIGCLLPVMLWVGLVCSLRFSCLLVAFAIMFV